LIDAPPGSLGDRSHWPISELFEKRASDVIDLVVLRPGRNICMPAFIRSSNTIRRAELVGDHSA
jgi:hypothetical protein